MAESSASSNAIVALHLTGKPLAPRVRFSEEDQMNILKKIVAARTHVAKYGSVVRKFNEAARAINANPHFRTSIKTRAVQEKFAKMVKEYRAKDRKYRAASGLGGEESPMEEMLAGIVEEMDGEQEAKRKGRDETTRAEKRKLEAGERVLEMAMGGSCRGVSSGITESGDESDANDGPPKGPNRRHAQPRGNPRIEDGLTAFGSLIREAELAKVELEKQRLEFEQHRHNDLMHEREAERKAKAQESEQKERADMECINPMLDFAVSSINIATEK